jgi:glycosyltransferase involved in cell wall biosynthesis/5'(3')-deoxyribonucleotidase
VVVLSPKNGDIGARFVECGASVRIGVLEELLSTIRDVFCIICNTIMTADIIVSMADRPFPTIWILHEWWDDEQIEKNLAIRNYEGLTLQTVKLAMRLATRIVCVCQSQKDFYNPDAPTSVVYVGVPDPVSVGERALSYTIKEAVAQKKEQSQTESNSSDANSIVDEKTKEKPFTFLCLGIICPRKNQHYTVDLFKKFAEHKTNVRLQIVGARYTRDYEIEYLELVRSEAADDPRIEIYDVTDQVDHFYREADCLILTSQNEVTPMVISEAMSRGIPVLTTDIAGIKEMVKDGVEGFHFRPDDEVNALQSMETIYSNAELREKMSRAARARFEKMFSQEAMADSFRELLITVAPPVVLVDMDGTIVNWDKEFVAQWKDRSPIIRTKAYKMEDCVPPEFQQQAIDLFHSKGFFSNLEWIDGAEQALKEMKAAGFQVHICTSPIRGSQHCAQEKIEWIISRLGEEWLDDLIICYDKVRNKLHF